MSQHISARTAVHLVLARLLLAFSAFAITLVCLADLAQSTGWQREWVDQRSNFEKLTDRSLRIDGSGHLHIAYGGDYLYHTWHDGSSWHREMVDSCPGTGPWASLALDPSGCLHIAYGYTPPGGQGTEALKYACQDPSGWHIETLWSGPGERTSVAVDSAGFPHICHCSGSVEYPDYDLNYAYKDGAGWHHEVVESTCVSRDCSMALDSGGAPHISFYDHTNGDLKYASRHASGWTVQTVHSTGNVGSHCSIALDANGKPRISYRDNSNANLGYARLTGTFWQIETPDAGGQVGGYTSLALDASEYAYISYYDNANGDLRLAYQDAAGWHVSTLESEYEVGAYTSLALDSGSYPHVMCTRWIYIYPGIVSYRTLVHTYQNYSGWHSETMDRSVGLGGSSMALDTDGNPHAAYLDESRRWLHYAQEDGQAWQSAEIDTYVNSYQPNYICGSTGIAADPDGYPRIAYHRVHNWAGGADVNYAYPDAVGWHTEWVASGYGSAIGTDRGLVLRPGAFPSISYAPGNVYGSTWHNHAWKDSIWHAETIEAMVGDPLVVQSGSVAIDASGYPHTSYRNWSLWELHYAYKDAGGWHVENVAPMSRTGPTSLALDGSGFPHVSYRGSDDMLKHAYKDGAGWHIETVVADAVTASSLALDPWGNVHVAYHHDMAPLDNLRYAYRDASGVWHAQTADADCNVGDNCSLAIDASGCPHIVYGDGWGDIRYAYLPMPPVAALWGELVGSELVLSWVPIPSAAAYWMYGADNQAYFEPEMISPYQFRLAVLPSATTTWSSSSGIGYPDTNWTYMVLAVDAGDSELWRSNRVGEHDFPTATPP